MRIEVLHLFLICLFTGFSRGQMINCYHKPCDSIRPPHRGEFANFEFYKHTLQTLLHTTIELSKSSCFPTKSLKKFYSIPSTKITTNMEHQTPINPPVKEENNSHYYSHPRAVGNDMFPKHAQPAASLNDFIKLLKSL